MRRFLSCLVALAFVALAACNCGLPSLTVRSPLLLDSEAQTVAGPRLMQAPAYYAPSWSQIQAPSACGPAFYAPPSYTTPRTARPCDSPTNGEPPQSIPAAR